MGTVEDRFGITVNAGRVRGLSSQGEYRPPRGFRRDREPGFNAGAQVVERAQEHDEVKPMSTNREQVLLALAEAGGEVAVGWLEEKTGIGRQSLYAILSQLRSRGKVAGEKGKYRLAGNDDGLSFIQGGAQSHGGTQTPEGSGESVAPQDEESGAAVKEEGGAAPDSAEDPAEPPLDIQDFLRRPAGGDMVNHPPHYTRHPSGVECIEVTEHMGFCVGNAIKYLWRADLKGNALEDLEKARWYVEREIARRRFASRRQEAANQ
jgi:hypothetical protein